LCRRWKETGGFEIEWTAGGKVESRFPFHISQQNVKKWRKGARDKIKPGGGWQSNVKAGGVSVSTAKGGLLQLAAQDRDTYEQVFF
jgi:hypothetical protein